jgi:hypothetical protein
MKQEPRPHRPVFAGISTAALAGAAALLSGANAYAVEIETSNPDLKIRWDNTVRYNLGMRMEGQDPRIMASPSYDESNSKFGRHDVVTNRLDLLSEIDLNYKKQYGLRVSAAGWYDQAYHDRTVTAPALNGAFQTSYANNRYNSSVSRYVNGPSAEFLDAFVWGNFNLGEVPFNVKLGRHTLAWGEGLLIGGHAISYSQSPADGVKALTSPGIETKEVFLPLNQISLKAQVTNDLSVMAQYFLEWKPTRVPHGGTYLMGADTAPTVDRLPAAPGFSLPRTTNNQPGNTGNFGVGLRYNASAIDATLGAYYRRFDDYAPETGIQMLGATGPFRFTYARNVELFGVSMAKAVGPVSVGAELSYRKNGHLNSRTTYSPTQNTGARGNTLHAIVNGLYGLPKSPLWDTGIVMAELAYARLLNVTENEDLYRGVGYSTASCTRSGTSGATAQPGGKGDACSTRNFVQVAVNFTPQYLGVMPSWDLDLPVSLNYGVSGNSPTGSGFEKALTWSVGARLTYSQRHEFSLRYSDIKASTRYNAAGTSVIGGGGLGSIVGATDRGWLVFTYKTSL